MRGRSFPRWRAAALSLAAAAAAGAAGACAAAPAAGSPTPAAAPAAHDPAAHGPAARAAGAAATVNAADARFMTGMIPHHAQAVKIAAWAATHGASRPVRVLSERIVVGQRDEIELMRTWLADRGQPVPAADATHVRMTMNGMEHDMLMPGMLTEAELARLDAARGPEFDRLFLAAMIRHHEGAIGMVDELFAAHGAGQDETVFRFASDVYADQTTEIDHMQRMLAALPAGERAP